MARLICNSDANLIGDMQFFTAGDVLNHATHATPEDPVTIHLDDSIQVALRIMLENDFDQLPVVSEHGLEGAVTYKSIARYVKTVDDADINETSVKIALDRNPALVQRDHDLFDLFDTFAKDDFVIIVNQDDIDGILTRYDVFYFLEYHVEPFLKIGEIEESLRTLIRNSTDDLQQRINDSFGDRAEHNESYEIPGGVREFTFDEYRMFMMRNLEYFPERISNEREMVENLLENVRDIRNAILHFRAAADEVDRDLLDLAHGYFTGIAGEPG